jgi:hypothetical protein
LLARRLVGRVEGVIAPGLTRLALAWTSMTAVTRKILMHDKLRFAITVSGMAFAVILVCVQVGLSRVGG